MSDYSNQLDPELQGDSASETIPESQGETGGTTPTEPEEAPSLWGMSAVAKLISLPLLAMMVGNWLGAISMASLPAANISCRS